jgi:hypothetical protein
MTGKPAPSKPRTAFLRLAFVRFGLLLALILVGSCDPMASPPTIDESASHEVAARQSLIRFFHDLNHGDYEAAEVLYGGSYETMAAQNPGIDTTDRAALLRAACTLNGAQCLEIRSARLVWSSSADDGGYTFVVEFSQAEGGRFSLSACCGDSAEGMAPKTEFQFEVKEVADHQFKVLTAPVYLP